MTQAGYAQAWTTRGNGAAVLHGESGDLAATRIGLATVRSPVRYSYAPRHVHVGRAAQMSASK
ncbi:hypothetical protein WS67_20910 [Burkholderia singularis]|uniref:Uncharacterized protein n=1 Tax=Burkholderia singularis TaxID=1503053 RepID=A0A103DXJ8_9BURK|nr:hypothetical protein WS67_20910 [Burkholderia singularis]